MALKFSDANLNNYRAFYIHLSKTFAISVVVCDMMPKTLYKILYLDCEPDDRRPGSLLHLRMLGGKKFDTFVSASKWFSR